jgi:hypothetical protein
LDLIDDAIYKDLRALNEIRNAFAHATDQLHFDSPKLVRHFQKLSGGRRLLTRENYSMTARIHTARLRMPRCLAHAPARAREKSLKNFGSVPLRCRRGRLRFSLYLDHFGLLSWVVTADRAATTTTPRRPSGAGGSEEQSSEESGFVKMVDIDGIQKCVDLLHDCIQE